MDDRPQAEPLIVLVQASTGMRGPHRTVSEFATWLAPRRDVVLAAPAGWVLKRTLRAVPEIRTLTLPGDRRANRAASVRALMTLARDENRPVIFHANGLSALNLVAPAALRHRSRVLVHFHAFELQARQRVATEALLKMGVPARFHAVSDFARGLLEGTGIRRAVGSVLPNPFDASIFPTEHEPGTGPFRVGWVGGSDPRKGLRRVVEMAAACADLDIEWRLFGVTGDRYDDYVASCRAAAERHGVADRLTWMGSLTEPARIYGALDAVVVASELESFCRVAVEAMTSGLPVVATRIPGLSEVVWDGVSGLLFEPEDPAEGAAHVRRLATDEPLRASLAAGALAGSRRFEISRVGPQLERLYAQLTPSGSSRTPSPQPQVVPR